MKKKTIIKEQKGAALIEFAVVLIVLALLAIGTSEIGLLLYNKQVITNASREGARSGIVSGDDFFNNAAVREIVNTYCFGKDENGDGIRDNPRLITFGSEINELPPEDIILNPSNEGTRQAAGYGADFSVIVTYNYHFLIPSLFKMGTTIPIRGKTMMKMEDSIGSGS